MIQKENESITFLNKQSLSFDVSYSYWHFVFRTFLPKLSDCDTDDDVAMCFLKSKEGFEKYLQYLVGQAQAESAISDKTVHHFFKVVIDSLCR